MGELYVGRYERKAPRGMEQCPNCSKYKFATIQYFEYDSWWRALLDIHCLRIGGEWHDHRKMCDYCGNREKINRKT